MLAACEAAFVGSPATVQLRSAPRAVSSRKHSPGLRKAAVAVRMGIDIPLGGPAGPGGPGDAAQDAASQAVAAASESEMLLAELAFSPPEQLPRLVEKNLDRLNEEFYTFLAAKIKASTDPDEKETLTLLKDAVTDLMEKILKAAMQRGDLTEEDVKAAGLTTPAIDIGTGDDMAVLSYDQFINELTADPSKIDIAVEAAFDRIDMRFLERLNERVQVCVRVCVYVSSCYFLRGGTVMMMALT
jgi:hypothetical protein